MIKIELQVSDSASKEYNIEKIMDKMKEDWDPIIVECKSWKDTGTFIMAGQSYDDAQQILDD